MIKCEAIFFQRKAYLTKDQKYLLTDFRLRSCSSKILRLFRFAGALNLGNCRVERLIPIWLLVSGSLLSVIQLVSIGKRIRKKCCSSSESEQNEQNEQNQGFACLITIFTFVSLGWFFAGKLVRYQSLN